MSAAPPGPDEIVVAVPRERDLCNSRGHRDNGRAADVQVAFGTFGSHSTRDVFWPETWGRTFPFCGERWKGTFAALQKARPHLAVRDGVAR